MNIFEGARRIAKIFYALILLVGLLIAFGTSPYLSRYYAYDDKFDLILVDNCGGHSWFTAKIEGRPAWAAISVCGSLEGPDTVSLNNVELGKLDESIYQKKFEHYGGVAFGTLMSVAGAMVFVWCVGWITRGFLGIPRGQDSKVLPQKREA